MVDTDKGKSSARDSAIAILQDEHHTLTGVVDLLQRLLDEISRGHGDPDFGLLATILYYLDAFSESVHHPKEDEHLFKRLRMRTRSADALLDELQREHITSAQLMTYLQRAFVGYQGGEPDGFKRFADAINAYAALLRDHMGQEENRVLPLAEQQLQDEDWLQIERAFCANRDPLGAELVREEFRKLRLRIVNRLPSRLRRRVDAGGPDRE